MCTDRICDPLLWGKTLRTLENPEICARAEICESRAYHLVGAIQPHGALLAIDPENFAVKRASENIEIITGKPLDALFGVSLLDLVDAQSQEKLLNFANERQGGFTHKNLRTALTMSFTGAPSSKDILSLLYFSKPYLCVEFPFDLDSQSSTEERLDALLFGTLNDIMLYDGPSEDLGGIVCRAIQTVTGLDRVYLCKFDRLGHGYIAAESQNGSMPSLLHHHFPKTDMPERVREYYVLNPFRMIPDVNARTIPIMAAAGADGAPLDLTLSSCRQVASTHLQYVRNMGVRATASFSIVEDGRLTGIFGGHSLQPHYIGYRRLVIAQNLVDLYRTLHSFLHTRELEQLFDKKKADTYILASEFVKANCRFDLFVLDHWDRFMSLMDAEDIIVRFDDQFFPGRRLATKEARAIAGVAIPAMSADGIFTTSYLSGIAPELFHLREKACGCFALALDAEGRDFIIWLRGQQVVEQKWSGNPNEAIMKTVSGDVGPRNSFETYVKLVEGMSRQWEERHMELAGHFQRALSQALSNYYNLKARKAAEDVSRLNSEFVANVSHELRSPLHALINLSEIIIDKIDQFPQDKRNHYKTVIKERGQRILHLVNDLLDISRLETRRVSYSFSTEDIRKTIESAHDEVEGLIKRKSLTVNIDDTRTVRHIAFDAARMSQVIVNLLLNAIKFSPPSTTITLRLSDMLSDGEYDGLLIEVADQGIGVPDGEKEAIFDKFARSSRTEGAIGGVGLGLSICRQIVLGHDGRLWVENNKDGGASFFVRIPGRSPNLMTA
jgi:light-regulated signal transduction histidine kinase (bacteriophytochrome)